MLSKKQAEEQANVLEPKSLMREARQIADLSDFGDPFFMDRMSHVLGRASVEVDFKPYGLEYMKSLYTHFLVNRLRIQADLERHPEILQEDVSDPLIIIGLPRSGTTKLQRMMAAAPNMQKLYAWRLTNPGRFPNAVPGEVDPRIAAWQTLNTMGVDNQEATAAHASPLDDVEEEWVLFDFALDETVAGWTHMPLFHHRDWPAIGDREADRAAYRYVRTVLQYLQWQDGGRRGRPLLLKAVIHLPHMDALLECFPNAKLVHAHRNPHASIPSVAKLMWAHWKDRANFSKEFLGPQFLQWGSTAMNKYLEARRRLNLDGRILDVSYSDIRSNTMRAIARIYEHAGWSLTDTATAAMQRWEDVNPEGKHGKHEYAVEEFGLTTGMIDVAFRQYIDRFIHPGSAL